MPQSRSIRGFGAHCHALRELAPNAYAPAVGAWTNQDQTAVWHLGKGELNAGPRRGAAAVSGQVGPVGGDKKG